ncbi:sulfite exporter TauE/SafE family protein [Actibacterium sp. MT2.3-13A]|uniref:HoxN/HupN/NixA family nickel/cobalt transporter n=1 Tax=Actibacterium sp. MT2.3-13A TaxID=2828332 RepID=UPI001BA4572C|nr:sulfite exporter TauE/SafE family protein [Actibacterium sp. MT2.3-13A]
MDALAFLPLGMFVGMAHALEADHLAAVATMMDKEENRLRLVRRGAFWGLGHTISLFAICSVVTLFGLTISERVESALEFAVGVMIVLLGLNVLRKLRRGGYHAHVHEHSGHKHIHLHRHEASVDAAAKARHDHGHASRLSGLKPVVVGLMHGAAGSAGLLVLMVAAIQEPWQAYLYAAVFGLGSIMGMAALSAVVSLPLVVLHRRGPAMRLATSLAIGGVALYVGGALAYESFSHLAHL